jgi:hypothetical protein
VRSGNDRQGNRPSSVLLPVRFRLELEPLVPKTEVQFKPAATTQCPRSDPSRGMGFACAG